MKLSTLGAALAIALGSTSVAAQNDYQASEKAIQLAKDNILIDTHIDVPYRVRLIVFWKPCLGSATRNCCKFPFSLL